MRHLSRAVRLLAARLSWWPLVAWQNLTLSLHVLIQAHALVPLLQPAVVHAAIQQGELH